MKKRITGLFALLCAVTLMAAGCAAGRENAPSAQLTLPPAMMRYTAPENDVHQDYQQTVLLYLPSLDGSQLVALPVAADLTASRHRAQKLCEMLLAHPGTEFALPVTGEVTLTLSGTEAVEVSGNVATVSLGASALRLSHEQLFTVGQASEMDGVISDADLSAIPHIHWLPARK